MSFGDRLKFLREEKKLSREELASIFNISYSTISKYETNVRTPDDELKKRIAAYFDVSLDFLMGTSDIRNPYINMENNSLKEQQIIVHNASETLADEFIQILIDEGLIEEGQELTPEEREMYLDIFKQSIKLAKKLKNRP